jgi:hypothetical protein
MIPSPTGKANTTAARDAGLLLDGIMMQLIATDELGRTSMPIGLRMARERSRIS